MKKITKSLMALALLVLGVTTANAATESGQKNLTFKTESYCAAKWDASTNTFRWSGKDQVLDEEGNPVLDEETGEPTYQAWGWNPEWTFMAIDDVSGDLSGYKKLHLKMTDFTNSAENKLKVVFKENNGSNPPSGPTQEFDAIPDENGVWELDLTTVKWKIDIKNIQDVTIYGGARTDNTAEGSVKVTDAWIEFDIVLGSAVTLTEQEDGSFLVEGLLDFKAYTNIGAWGGTWSGNNLEKQQDWTSYEYVWIKYKDFSGALNFGVMYSEWMAHQSWGEQFRDATVAVKDPSGVIGVKLDQTSVYEKGTAENDGKYIGDTYAQHIREMFIQATAGGTNITIEGMYVGTEDQYLAAKEANQWVDPTVYVSLIENGDFEGSGNVNFVVKQAAQNGAFCYAEIVDGIGVDGSNGITIQAADGASQDWDSQFWIKFNKKIPTGTKLKIKFDYKAAKAEKVSTQLHTLPGAYIWWNALGELQFDTNWKTYEETFTVPKGDKDANIEIQSFAFNMACGKQFNNFYLDNFVVEIDEEVLENLADGESANYGEQKIYPTSPWVGATIGDEKWASFVPAKSVTVPEGVKAYAVALDESKKSVTLEEVSEITTGTPVIVNAEEAGDYIFMVADDASFSASNDLTVSDGSVAGDGSSIYVLANGSHDVGFYLLAEGVKIPAGKAYLEVPSGSAREFIGFGDATAIKSVETVKANGAVYNLAGQQVKNAQKGIFIIDGKKVIK